MRELIVILLGGILVNNVMLTRILGVCPFIGVSKQVETATGMGMAVIFVMTVASAVTWLIQNLILNPFNMGYLQTVSFILVIAALVQLIEMVVLKVSPTLYRALGIYLPLITTNCAVLGVAILNIRESYNLLEAAVSGLAGGAGFALAIILFAAMRERQELAPISRAMVGFPIALVTTGLMAMAFLGFSGQFFAQMPQPMQPTLQTCFTSGPRAWDLHITFTVSSAVLSSMMFRGHARTHFPHPVHAESSTTGRPLGDMCMASKGHAATQVPSPRQP